MNLMEHEVMAAPIGAEAAGEQKQTIEKARTKIIDAAPLMERLKAAIAFGNEKGLPTDELEQVLADIEGMEELPPSQPEIIDGRLFVTVDDIEKVGCVLVDEHKSNFCRQFWMDGDGPAQGEDAVSRAWLLAEYDRQHQGPPGGARKIIEAAPPVMPKQRTGHWIIEGTITTVRGYWAKCSECGHTSFGGGRFCRECGAPMNQSNKTCDCYRNGRCVGTIGSAPRTRCTKRGTTSA